ncbi:MAG: MazG family protein, partial [Alphaproteobacteria bacterium]
DKLVRRHPHVFDRENHDPETGLRDEWESLKADERAQKAEKSGGGDVSALDDVPVALPALTRAEKLQKRAARVGFDWASVGPVLEKIEEEISELKAEMAGNGNPDRLADEMGDVLFSCVNLARHLKVDPEFALRGTNTKFETRFRRVEDSLRKDGVNGRDVGIEDYERRWQAAKTDQN